MNANFSGIIALLLTNCVYVCSFRTLVNVSIIFSPSFHPFTLNFESIQINSVLSVCQLGVRNASFVESFFCAGIYNIRPNMILFL